MFARIGAKAILAMTGVALVFFGVGLLGLALAHWLAPHTSLAGGYAIAGAIFLGPPLVWALLVCAVPRRQPAAEKADLMNTIFRAIARETPWAAVAGAGLVGVANLFLNRNKNKK